MSAKPAKPASPVKAASKSPAKATTNNKPPVDVEMRSEEDEEENAAPTRKRLRRTR